MTRAELLALAERVEAGETGGSIRLPIARAIGWTEAMIAESSNPRRWLEPGFPAWETSIDAQAALPAWIMRVELAENPNHFVAYALMKIQGAGINMALVGCAPTEPAARLAAILRAMAEKAPEA